MSTKHTPAPWVLEIRNGLGNACREATVAEIGTSGKYRGGIAYAQSAEHIDGICKDELIANARLIAAAPDLLDACRMLLASAQDHQTGVAEAETAIAKAEGRS